MNKIQIIGRLTANPELRTTGTGLQVCTFNVAVSRRFNRDEVDFFPVTTWRDVAINCNKYLAKGSQVGVCGSLQIKRYEDKDGIKRTAVDLQAEEVEFLSQKSTESQQTNVATKQTTIDDLLEVDDEDMPF